MGKLLSNGLKHVFLLNIIVLIVQASAIQYNGSAILFENAPVAISTCFDEECDTGFVNMVDDNSSASFWINTSGRPILDKIVSINIDYSLPNNEGCIIRFSSNSPYRTIQQDNTTNMLFSDGNSFFIISENVMPSTGYEIHEKDGDICIGTINKTGVIKLYLESTGSNAPLDYYRARLYGTFSVGAEVELDTSSVQLTNNLAPYIFEVEPFSFSTPTVEVRIPLSNCTNMTFYYKDSLGAKTSDGCTFEGQLSVAYDNYLLIPFDSYSAEITTNESLIEKNGEITVLPSEKYRGSLRSHDNAINIEIYRSDESKATYVGIVIISLACLYAIFQSNEKKERNETVKIIGAIAPIVTQILFFTEYVFAIPSLAVIICSLYVTITLWSRTKARVRRKNRGAIYRKRI